MGDKEKYDLHECGGSIVDGDPHYIPLGTDSIMQIIDRRCTKCGCLIVGMHQKTTIIKNQKAHDLLTEILKESLHPKEG